MVSSLGIQEPMFLVGFLPISWGGSAGRVTREEGGLISSSLLLSPPLASARLCGNARAVLRIPVCFIPGKSKRSVKEIIIALMTEVLWLPCPGALLPPQRKTGMQLELAQLGSRQV